MKKRFLAICSFIFLFQSVFSQTKLDKKIVSKVTASVFEVVVDKIDDTTIEYEEDLPFDRLPYAERNDKYLSIGTAFLLEDGKFYSASHVFTLFGDTVYKNYYIRDDKGTTYPVKDIVSLSNRRDFISFTVPSYKAKKTQGLKISTKIDINSIVYSVGNALGDGVVFRDGILTSLTKEDRDGEWDWIRFSAAASPGNSGGPLINENGEVIGIITMKSQNENLNYALPINEIETGKDGIGIIDTNFYYTLPNVFNKKQFKKFEYKINLPVSYTELHSTLTKAYKEYIKDVVQLMRNDYGPGAPKSFSKAKGNAEFFFGSYSTSFPLTIYLNETGTWDYGGTNTKTADLYDNGTIEHCNMLGYTLAKLSKPDSMSLEELLSNPKTYVDMAIDTIGLTRNMAGERIPIKTLGEPIKIDKYNDFFGRTWTTSYFDIKFADSVLICYALPLPTGVYMMYSVVSQDAAYSSIYLDMEFVADFLYTSYFGKIKNWKEFIALPESIMGKRPDFLKNISIKSDENHFSINVDAFSTDIPSSVFKIDDETNLLIMNSFTTKNNKLEIENRAISVYSNSKTNDYKFFSIKKAFKPMKNISKNTKTNWEQFVNKVSPYDGEPYNHESYTYLDTIYTPDPKNDDPDYLYIVCFELKKDMFTEIKEFGQQVIDCTKF